MHAICCREPAGKISNGSFHGRERLGNMAQADASRGIAGIAGLQGATPACDSSNKKHCAEFAVLPNAIKQHI